MVEFMVVKEEFTILFPNIGESLKVGDVKRGERRKRRLERVRHRCCSGS